MEIDGTAGEDHIVFGFEILETESHGTQNMQVLGEGIGAGHGRSGFLG